MMKSKKWALVSILMLVSLVLAACAPQQVQVPVTVVVKETQVVKQVETQVVKQVETSVVKETQVVQVETAKKAFTTPHPILGDVRVRQAIAYCYIPTEVIKSVYPFLSEEDQLKLLMPTNIPQNSWAFYGGPEVMRYFDPKDPTAGPAKGKKLLDEAGWTAAADGDVRADKDGNTLSIKFTTTTAAFRKTWSAVFIQQLAACGIEVLPLYAPASWWFGATTGTRHRDFELGAFAWVGENDPKGQTLYACNQIPLPENGWQGQNYMGWCNKTASDAINAANNSIDKAERIKQYKIFQIEFAKDMVSLPMFQRAEGNAATTNLKNFKPSATEYYTWNAWEWELTDGGDTLVVALSQEPDSMYSLVSNMAAQRTVAWLYSENSASQFNWDFQPWQLAKLPTLDSGLTKLADVDVKAGDPVVDSNGTPVDADGKVLTLVKGLKVKTADGTDVEYSGSGTVKMKQMTTTYQFQPNLKWSDGEPVVKADFELGYKNDCDPASGAVDYSLCQSIQKVDFTGDTEYTVTWKPGYQSYLSTIYAPVSYYPSHQVIQTEGANKGKKLSEVPTTDWSALPEIAETPLATGPYVVKTWEKGVKLELEANPNYWRGPVKIKKITVMIIQDTQQAVAQLLTGDVDVIGSETLGAGAEVQTVLDAQKAGKPVQVLIEASATWEHTDINLFIP